jgi:glutaredoxin
MKKILLPTLLSLLLIGVAVWALLAEKQPASQPPNISGNAPVAENMVFYYGDGCPHCANVEKYFADNQVAAKITFTKKEVYNNQANRNELIERATACGLAKDSIGIPLLWHDGQCVSGDTDIINFFEQKLKAN